MTNAEEFYEELVKLKACYNKLNDKYNYLSQQLESWNKDKEIQQAEEQTKYAREHSLLILSDKELKSINEFRERHYKECALPYHSKTKGNTYIYTLTGTGLGTIIEITCPICGATLDVTDISSW